MNVIRTRALTMAVLLLSAVWHCGAASKDGRERINLDGTWRFTIDRTDAGKGQWYNVPFDDEIILPGSMTTNNKGDNVSITTPWIGTVNDQSFFKNPEYGRYREDANFKIPFWLQPVKYYSGVAWYQRDVEIPKDWDKQAVELFLERCHWETRLWVDEREVGMRNALGAPHRYDLTDILTPGKHRITLRIDNRVKEIDPGVNSHSISDHTQGNWNGVVGEMFLERQPQVRIKHIQIHPDIHKKSVKIRVNVQNGSGEQTPARLSVKVSGKGVKKSIENSITLQPGNSETELELSLGAGVKLWNEFHPALYNLTVVLADGNSGKTDKRAEKFGMREFKVDNGQMVINGKPVFLRGTLDCAAFPKTGYCPTDIDSWLKIFNTCREHGLNHVRYHSWCPPKAAFEAADQLGFYLEVECSSWASESTQIGEGQPIDQFISDESHRIVEEFGNHPSFCMMMYGNEPAGKKQGEFLTDFVNVWKQRDNRRIYSSGGGWPQLPVNEFLSTPSPRIQGWGEGLRSIINAQPPRTNYDWRERIPQGQPTVSHEIGQWCVYPNFKEMTKYDGVLRPRNFEIFQESLTENGMLHLADSFLLASGKLQALCYKADIEAALRTKDFGGFQLLGLYDFPGQGTALVGVLDAFWEEKGYITPAEYRRFCNSTVPLLRMNKCVFDNNETFHATVEVAHYGDSPMVGITPVWKITDKSGYSLFKGELANTDIPLGNDFQLGEISVPLATITTPQQLSVEVSLGRYSNSWDIWVYPAVKKTLTGEAEIRMVDQIDNTTMDYLQNGGKVLLTLKKGALPKDMGGNVAIGFSSIFWNTAWTGGQAPHTLGILCAVDHPALSEFPTEYYSNYQWWDAMSHSGAINIGRISKNIQPIVRVIDDWVKNRPLALLFDAKVGKGRIVVAGIDFVNDIETRPEARQLLYSIKKYMLGEEFNPTTVLEPEQINRLFK